MLTQINAILLEGSLKTGDLIGFTFFIGTMAMFAASVFFFFERAQVAGKWKTSMLISGLITMIAAVHYYYMRDVWISTGTSPTEFRYIDWTLTVPLMCVEFYLLIKPYGGKMSTLWRLIAYSVFMLVTGYIGEALDTDRTALWGAISTLGYVGILYEATMGSVKQVADSSPNPEVARAVRLLRNFVLVGWAIYPIGYMARPGGLLSGAGLSLDLIYNIGDAINKIGFGLVVYMAAINSTKSEAEKTGKVSAVPA